jgi:hypothetical protein
MNHVNELPDERSWIAHLGNHPPLPENSSILLNQRPTDAVSNIQPDIEFFRGDHA